VDVLVARQAIFDRKRNLYGYELLYRSSGASLSFDGVEAGAATTEVLSNTLLSIGAENVLGGKKGFINFDHRLLAEKVETHAEFEWARRAGYALFQGYFFARPVIVRGRQIPAVKIACLRLVREVQQPNLDFPHLEELLREDVALTYRLLRYVNSALLSRGTSIDSIGRALLVLGEDGLRHWVALATLPTLATNKPTELLTLALVRARFCERLAELARAAHPNRAFLMGMFSLLDALTDQPLDAALGSVDLGSDVTEALLGIAPEGSFLARTYELIRSYEQGHWDQVEELSRKCRIPFLQIGRAYLDSTDWAEQVVHVGRD
jgi:c-di-GMP phosphodiesterase